MKRNVEVTEMPATDALALPGWLLAPLLIGAIGALAGGYWDDAWHTERGRDGFFIPPHIAIYGGIGLAGAALTCWVILAARRAGPRAVLRHGPLTLALLAVGATLVSGPIDNFWHVAFGRDAVIWSPPHTLGIVGTAALGSALLIEPARSRAWWAPFVRSIAGAFVLAALTFLVIEYETDVPQFDPVWYLPVLGLTSALALGIVRRATPEPWAATRAAAVQLGFVVLVTLLLVALGFDLPKPPLLVLPALVLDYMVRRGVTTVAVGAAYTATLFMVYVPSTNWAGSGVQLDAADVLAGLPLTLVVVTSALLATLGPRPSRAWLSRASALAAVLALLVLPAAAFAHDPGQGKEAGTMALAMHGGDREISARAALPSSLCTGLDGAELVARRAGIANRAPMRRFGCKLEGRVSAPARGRWFTYVELRRGARRVEAWLPVKMGGKQVTDPHRYAYVSDKQAGGTAKLVSGTTLYGLMLALLGGVIVLVRRSNPGPSAICTQLQRQGDASDDDPAGDGDDGQVDPEEPVRCEGAGSGEQRA